MKNEPISVMWDMLPVSIQKALARAIKENRSSREVALLRPCPHCGEKSIMDCSLVDGIEDITVGLCSVCGYLWCLECDASLLTSPACGHWLVCEICDEEKEHDGFCGIMPWDCKRISEWLARNHPTV